MSEIKYQPNSHKSKEEQKTEEKRAVKVVSGSVKTRKRGELRKLTDTFISEDVRNVKSYVLTDVIVPAVKKVIVDIVTDGIHMIFYGGTKRTEGSRFDRPSYVNYSKISSGDSSRPSYASSATSYRSEDLVFETRADAEEVLANMDAIVERYGVVRVLDLYDMVQKTCDHTANKYGWTSTRSAEIQRIADGYVIRMPRPMPIER